MTRFRMRVKVSAACGEGCLDRKSALPVGEEAEVVVLLLGIIMYKKLEIVDEACVRVSMGLLNPRDGRRERLS